MKAAPVIETREKWGFARYAAVAAAVLLISFVAVAVALAIQDRTDRTMMAEISREESELRELGTQIASLKDATLTTTNDFIAAYAQVEPLEKEYDQKLQKFSELYRTARERDSHRSVFDLQRFRGTHHPENWEKMSQIIDLVRQINDTTKREISVVHAMAALPEPERMRFWHEQFMPLAAQEHALREELRIVGQEQPPDSSAQ